MTDVAQHVITAAVGSTVDDLYDLYDLRETCIHDLYDLYGLIAAWFRHEI